MLLLSNAWVLGRARPHLFDLDHVPPRTWAMVLGAHVYPSGEPCALLADRLRATATLVRAGRVQKVLITGAADEVGPMGRFLSELVSVETVLDGQGVRTFESCRRARSYGALEMVIVTNRFHLARSVYLARAMGLDAVGARAPLQSGARASSLVRSEARELAARLRAVVDVVRA